MKTDLFAAKSKEYGDNYKQHLFEQYKMLIESIEKTSDRRLLANNTFIAINSAIFTLIGLTFQIESLNKDASFRMLLSIIGILISIIFFFLIRSYKQLNSGKFIVVHEIEDHLPLRLYKYEWKKLGEGKDSKKYYPFSHIEMLLPWSIILIYGIVIIYCI
jgi:hypothetical protein